MWPYSFMSKQTYSSNSQHPSQRNVEDESHFFINCLVHSLLCSRVSIHLIVLRLIPIFQHIHETKDKQQSFIVCVKKEIWYLKLQDFRLGQ